MPDLLKITSIFEVSPKFLLATLKSCKTERVSEGANPNPRGAGVSYPLEAEMVPPLLNCKRSSTASHFTNFSPEKYSQKLSVLSKLCLEKKYMYVYNSFTPKDKDTLCGFPTQMYFNPQWCGICAASKVSFYSFASRE